MGLNNDFFLNKDHLSLKNRVMMAKIQLALTGINIIINQLFIE